ncbi:MAG: permease [Candidatus Nezhaarchaeales archaeon]
MDLSQLSKLLEAGFYALVDYIAYHVITCLIPAFLLAGAVNTFISRDAIIKYLGLESRKIISFPLAAISSFGLAVCSCTVIPIAAGLYRRGSSIGPAFIFLWLAPAANILALTYTGAILGVDIALMRVTAAFIVGLAIGLAMSVIFRKEELLRLSKTGGQNVAEKTVAIVKDKRDVVLIVLLISTLLLPNYLGTLLNGDKLLVYGYKLLIFAVSFVVTMSYALKFIERERVGAWLHETLWFVRMIFPLLLIGAFIIGVVSKLLPEWWIREWLGGNGLLQTFIACFIGALSYFATLTEAPFVATLMNLGMGKSPALALLLTGPGMSLPNMLAISRVFTLKKAVVCILLTIVIATLTSYVIGNTLWITS